MSKLFEIENFYRNDGYIIVEISPTKFIDDTTICIPEHKFERWLNDYGYLHIEHADCSYGQLIIKEEKLDLDGYFDTYDWNMKAEHLYDYISTRHIDIDKAWETTFNFMQSILKHFKQ
jgi:hypothetical protein